MAQRSDLTINWDLSPRIITVASPSVEITMQDLLDTLRFIEASAVAMDDASIVDASGKEDLGGGTKVGLTVQLLDSLVAFEARPGPEYIQCNISGGNLVALNLIGDTVSPISPTAFTQIVLANSSSATLQEQSALQYSSFNGGVTFDITSPYSGTEYPIGTPQEPVNNVYDAADIAYERGFTTGYVIGDLTFPIDLPLVGFTFIGSGKDRSLITIPDAANVSECTYIDCEITGFLDGNNVVRDCLINNLSYIKGFIETCVLGPGTIVLSGTEIAHFLDCWSGQPGTGTPIIDMNGAGQALALRNYNGGIKLINKTGTESVSIDLNSGQVVLDLTTVISGTIIARGVGKLVDTFGEHIHTGTYGTLDIVNELIEGSDIRDIHAAHFNKRVWDKNGNTITIYDTDGTTVLFVFDTNADMSNITPQ